MVLVALPVGVEPSAGGDSSACSTQRLGDLTRRLSPSSFTGDIVTANAAGPHGRREGKNRNRQEKAKIHPAHDQPLVGCTC